MSYRSSCIRAALTLAGLFGASLILANSGTAAPCVTAAAQFIGKPTQAIAPERAAEILTQAAQQLWDGSLLSRLPPGHKLFTVCVANGEIVATHVAIPGMQQDTDAARQIVDLQRRIKAAARILDVEEAFEASRQQRGLPAVPALWSIGPLGLAGTFAPGIGLVSLSSTGDTGNGSWTIAPIHEVLGHRLFHLHCAAPLPDDCAVDRDTFISSLVDEAHSATMDHLYTVFWAERNGDLASIAGIGHRGYDGQNYMALAVRLMAAQPEFAASMRQNNSVPRALMARMLEATVLRPMPYYLLSAVKGGLEFGSDRDLAASLLRIPYLDDADRERIAAAIKVSAWYRRLGNEARPSRAAVSALLGTPAAPISAAPPEATAAVAARTVVRAATSRPAGRVPPRTQVLDPRPQPQPPPRRIVLP